MISDEAMALVERVALLCSGKTREVARCTGYSEITVRRWRRGTLNPGPNAIEALRALESRLDPSGHQRAAMDAAGSVCVGLVSPREVRRGLVDLRKWVDPEVHPPWLLEAAARAKGLSSLCTWLGTTQAEGQRVVNQDLALERAHDLNEDIEQPIYVRRLWGHAVRLLIKRGARPAKQHQPRRIGYRKRVRR